MMTDDEIERLALAAGCFTPGASRNYWAITDKMLRRFAELAQEAGRNNSDDLRQQVEDQAAEIQRLRAALEVSQAATNAAVNKAQFQASTNAELNALHDQVRRLKAEACRRFNDDFGA